MLKLEINEMYLEQYTFLHFNANSIMSAGLTAWLPGRECICEHIALSLPHTARFL